MHNDIIELESIINYSFLDKELLSLALTHPSYANENKIDKLSTNQRLEFLGDAVLELVSSDFLYKTHQDFDEGSLTKTRSVLVCEESLADVARKLRLYDFLHIGKGESSKNLMNNNSTMCDTLESLIGAIYLDTGIDSAKEFIYKYILTYENLNRTSNDYKSLLQEKANSKNLQIRYEVIKEYGPDHDKNFKTAVYIGDKILGTGTGKSKKEAEQNAAKQAIDKF